MSGDIESAAAAAVRLAGGARLGSVLAVAEPDAWLALDAGVRASTWHRSRFQPRWELDAPLPPDLNGLDESRLALALCHRDGRIRERAVRASGGRSDLLPLIVIRSADWVAPVRAHARQLLRETLDMDAALGLAPLILRVGRRDRGAFGVDALSRVLGQASRAQLAVLLRSSDRDVRRFTYRLAVERRLFDRTELARTAARDSDTVVQDVCATAALSVVGGEDAWGEAVALLLSARNPRTRSAGVTALRRAGLAAQAEAFLADRSALVRACARYVVRQAGGDPTACYRQRCTAPDDLASTPGAVIGLAECGNRGDAALLWPLLTHPVAAVRASAVAALRTLDCADAHRLRLLMDDPAAGVVRETVLALLPCATDLPGTWLLERTDARQPRHVRVGALRLLDARGGIIALRAAVGLLEDPDVNLRLRAGQSVLRWNPTSHARYGDAEVAELLDRSRHLVSAAALRRRK
ncbi:hypothetical protein ABT119_10240 [Streptomyces sp. NPDC001910]|uniref:hypothetical protein n=1 Tax=Streptomyces sp. NPDC001910 TaxID=3154403 RepID=UPI00331D728E